MARALATFVAIALLFPPLVGAAQEVHVLHTERSVSMYIAAVGQLNDGTLIGVLSVLTLKASAPGRGDVFVRTDPFAEVDMQGSARLAVAAAGELTGLPTKGWDFQFTVTTGSAIIGGPSAGGAMAMAVAAVLENWTLDPEVAMTGMIDPDLSIGLVGGVIQKAEAVAKGGVRTFLIPMGERIQSVTVTTLNADGSVSTRDETVDLRESAKDQWGLDVVEVEDLYDVVPHFTDVQIERPSVVTDPTREARYQSLMNETSRGQVDASSKQLDAVQGEYASHREGMRTGDRAAVEAEITAGQQAIQRAQDAAAAQRFYQASSFAFQSAVESRSAQFRIGFYDQAESPTAYRDAQANSLATETAVARRETHREFPLTASQLGAQAAVELRLEDAEVLLTQAREATDFTTALRSLAFAKERLGSARWWATLGDRLVTFGGPSEVTVDGLDALGDSYMATANLMVAYAERVLGESDDRLNEAGAELARGVESSEKDDVAATAFRALRAIALVNAAMAGFNPESALQQRLATLRNRTASDIETARAAGVEPVYAVSLYEFALGQQSTDAAEAYEGFSYARMAARATLVASGYEPPAANVIALPDEAGFTPTQRLLRGAAWAWLAVVGLPSALALIVGATLALGPLGRGKR